MTHRALSCGCGIFRRWKGSLLNAQRSFSSDVPDKLSHGLSNESPDEGREVSFVDISKLMRLRSLNDSDKNSKKIVIIFDWLYAKPAAVDKYCNLYHAKGLDVLTVKGRLAHFLWPPTGYELAKKVLKFIFRDNRDEVLVHAFSVGAYIYTLCLMISRREPEQYGAFRDKVKGQVFDSVVVGSYDHMSTGIAVALPGTNALKKPILQIMDVYYNKTKETTRDEYDKLVDLFKADPITVPTQLFYSYSDPMCYVPAMEDIIKNWHRCHPDFDVTSKCWNKSIHAAHLKCHPEEYLQHWEEWIQRTKITQDE
ncbi:uncharacterized protein LOC132548994 [Ylistrum balloti]|uniref:uncharacterized protein LOC132548994 n=1 Tax=Ylistrum balloti TaxID=509963 RepID=UPI002905EBE4|nr:uncharacterized protein LOC132548994 [Ylistrum balloti]XP_060068883.1 uncharacterized protein LOC132548994 [Ylistrum balloti]XP_060068884.1 uncharacterized protein LOC132548994 [Ylistrum balloti]XP_060068885.1 uncharacterized protein LOC132548994 [Ylistrum balloti]